MSSSFLNELQYKEGELERRYTEIVDVLMPPAILVMTLITILTVENKLVVAITSFTMVAVNLLFSKKILFRLPKNVYPLFFHSRYITNSVILGFICYSCMANEPGWLIAVPFFFGTPLSMTYRWGFFHVFLQGAFIVLGSSVHEGLNIPVLYISLSLVFLGCVINIFSYLIRIREREILWQSEIERVHRDFSDDGILMDTGDGFCIFNVRFKELFELSIDEDRAPSTLIKEISNNFFAQSDYLHAMEVDSGKSNCLLDDERVLEIQIKYVDSGSQRKMKIWYFRDVTADRAIEKLKLDEAREAGKAEIATSVLHNVNNILNSLFVSNEALKITLKKSNLYLLYKGLTLLKQHHGHIDDFLQEEKGKKLISYFIALKDDVKSEFTKQEKHLLRIDEKMGLIRDIVASQQQYAALGSKRKNTFLLTEVVESALQMLSESLSSRKVAIEREFNCAPQVTADKAQVTHILINLCKNAIEAMNNTLEHDRTIVITVFCKDEYASLSFTDNGMGIERHKLDKVFTYGFTTKSDGHGFGLHSCISYMREIGGNIAVKSEGKGKGSTFVLTFPLVETAVHVV